MPPNPFSRDPEVTVGVGADTDGFNEAIDGATGQLGDLRTAVGAAGAALGALGAGALTKATQSAASFEEAMVEVEKSTSPETADAMGESIQEMASEIPLAQSQLAGLAADAGRFGIEGPDAIESFTTSVAKMAESTNISAQEAGESLARLSELTNTPVSEVENLGSAINSLSNNFATSSQEIVDSMMRSSASLSQLGLNQREIAGLSASLNEVSESSERAGSRLRRLGQELLDPKKVSELAGALGMTETEFVQMREESPVELMQQMATTMGDGGDEADVLRQSLSTTSRQALSGLSQNLQGVVDAQQTANESFREGESLQREFEAATGTFNAKLDLFKNELRNAGIQIGQQLLPPLTDLLEEATVAIDYFEELNAESDGLAGALALAVTTVGGLSLAVGAFVGGPAALLVGALGSIGTAAGLLGVRFESVQDVFEDVQEAAGETFEVLGDVGEDVLDTATDAWEDHGDDVIDVAESGYETASDAVEDAAETVEDAVDEGLSLAADAWEDHAGEITTIASDAFGFVTDEASKILKDGEEPIVSGPLGLVKSAVENNFLEIKETVSTATSEMGDTLSTFGSTVDRQVIGPLNDSDSAASETLGSMKTEVRESFNLIRDIINRTVGVALPEVEELTESLGDTWRSNLSGENGIVHNARTAFNAIWNNIINPIINTIQSGWELFGDDILKVAEGAFGGIETTVDIAMGGVLSAINVVLDLLSGDFEGAFNTAKEHVFDTIGELAEFFTGDGKTAIEGAVGVFLTPIEGITDSVRDAFSYITGNGSGDTLSDDINDGALKDALDSIKSQFDITDNEDLLDRIELGIGNGNEDLLDRIKREAGITGAEDEEVLDSIKRSLGIGGGSEATLIGDLKDGLGYLTGTGDGTLIGDVKDGLGYLIGIGEDTLVSDITSSLSGVGAAVGSGIKSAINDALSLPFEHTIGRVKVGGKEIFGGQTISIPALETGGLIEQSGIAYVDEGEMFSGAPGAEVDRSPGMMLSKGELRDAVAEGVARAASGDDLFGVGEIVRALKEYAGGETTIEFRDEDRYRTVRR
jgi:TP901 family phage tail tape measure protein